MGRGRPLGYARDDRPSFKNQKNQKMSNVKVKFRKSHPEFAYFAGDVAAISDDQAAKLLESGHIMMLPDDEDLVNTLPEDLPGRVVLFKEGYDTAEKVKADLTAIAELKGIGKAIYKQIVAYFEKTE
jgi:hypothetical protein